MRPKGQILLTASALLILSGCLPGLGQDYYVSTPHRERQADTVADASRPVENVTGLHNAILRMVKAGEEEGVIRARNYGGDLAADLPGVIRDISREEPEGAYAVDYMSYDIVRMLTDYECKVHITYRRSKDQLDALHPISSAGQIPALLSDALARHTDVLALDIGYYTVGAYPFEDMLRNVYYENPETAMGLPVLSVSLYPDAGLRRIAEILIAYPDSGANLNAKAFEARNTAAALVREAQDAEPGAPMALALYDLLLARTQYDAETAQAASLRGDAVSRNDAYTPYGALVAGKAVSEGFALAYKWLCDLAGIPCRVVPGRRGADEHVWTLIRLEEEWYHADPASDARADASPPGHTWFLCPDEVMQDNYRWNRADFPAAVGTEYTYEGLAGLPDAAAAMQTEEEE